MVKTYRHPMRDAEIHVFERVESNGKGAEFIAQFHPYDKWPIQFRGDLGVDVYDRALEFKNKTIRENEEAAAERAARLEAMRDARAKAKGVA